MAQFRVIQNSLRVQNQYLSIYTLCAAYFVENFFS